MCIEKDNDLELPQTQMGLILHKLMLATDAEEKSSVVILE